MSGRLAQLRAAGQLLGAARPWSGPPTGAARTRSSACGPSASLGAYAPRARTPARVEAWGAAAVGPRARVRTWAPLAMAATVDLSTSTNWKEAKCKCEQKRAGEQGLLHVGLPRRESTPPADLGKLRLQMPGCGPPPLHSHAP